MNGDHQQDVLADLHAEQNVRAIRARAQGDPGAAEYLSRLDSTVATLRAHGADPSISATTPPEVADRVFQSLLAASSSVSVDEVAVRRSARRPHGLMIAAAASVVVAIGAGAGLALAAIDTGSTDDAVVASAPALDDRTVMSFVGSSDRGRLDDPVLLAGCLRANGLPATTTVVGSGRVSVNGIDATLLVVAAGDPGALVALAVGDRCGPGTADTVSRADVG